MRSGSSPQHGFPAPKPSCLPPERLAATWLLKWGWHCKVYRRPSSAILTKMLKDSAVLVRCRIRRRKRGGLTTIRVEIDAAL